MLGPSAPKKEPPNQPTEERLPSPTTPGAPWIYSSSPPSPVPAIRAKSGLRDFVTATAPHREIIKWEIFLCCYPNEAEDSYNK